MSLSVILYKKDEKNFVSFIFINHGFGSTCDYCHEEKNFITTNEEYVNFYPEELHDYENTPQENNGSLENSSVFYNPSHHGGQNSKENLDNQGSQKKSSFFSFGKTKEPSKGVSFDFPSTYSSTSVLHSTVSPISCPEYRFLYFMPFCPLSRKIFIGLREKGIAFKEFYEKTWDPSRTVLKLNPIGELPIFLDHQHICQNDFVAQDYIDEFYKDLPSLMGRTAIQRSETRFILSWFDRIFYHDVYWTLFYERGLKRQARQGVPDTSILKRGRENLKKHMLTLEYWTQQRVYLNGHQFSWADIAGIAHLSCIDYLGDISWKDYPWTKEWYVKIKSRPSVRPCLDWYFPGLIPYEYYGSLDF